MGIIFHIDVNSAYLSWTAVKVTINGEIVKKPESKLDAEDDQVELEHQPVIFEQFHYLMLLLLLFL